MEKLYASYYFYEVENIPTC